MLRASVRPCPHPGSEVEDAVLLAEVTGRHLIDHTNQACLCLKRHMDLIEDFPHGSVSGVTDQAVIGLFGLPSRRSGSTVEGRFHSSSASIMLSKCFASETFSLTVMEPLPS